MVVFYRKIAILGLLFFLVASIYGKSSDESEVTGKNQVRQTAGQKAKESKNKVDRARDKTGIHSPSTEKSREDNGSKEDGSKERGNDSSDEDDKEKYHGTKSPKHKSENGGDNSKRKIKDNSKYDSSEKESNAGSSKQSSESGGSSEDMRHTKHQRSGWRPNSKEDGDEKGHDKDGGEREYQDESVSDNPLQKTARTAGVAGKDKVKQTAKHEDEDSRDTVDPTDEKKGIHGRSEDKSGKDTSNEEEDGSKEKGDSRSNEGVKAKYYRSKSPKHKSENDGDSSKGKISDKSKEDRSEKKLKDGSSKNRSAGENGDEGGEDETDRDSREDRRDAMLTENGRVGQGSNKEEKKLEDGSSKNRSARDKNDSGSEPKDDADVETLLAKYKRVGKDETGKDSKEMDTERPSYKGPNHNKGHRNDTDSASSQESSESEGGRVDKRHSKPGRSRWRITEEDGDVEEDENNGGERDEEDASNNPLRRITRKAVLSFKTSYCRLKQTFFGSNEACGTWAENLQMGTKNMDQAEKECAKSDLSLIRLDSKSVLDDIKTTIASLTGSSSVKSYWVGLRRRDDVFQWPDGTTPSWTHWSPDLSSQSAEKKECVVAIVKDDHRWEPERCNKKHHFICQEAPVDGVWSDWGEWSDCPVTCGTGQQTRERTCNNPAPSGGGQQCEGDASENKECVLAQCQVDGVWSDWGEWSDCAVTCGTGRQIRERKCNNPAPSGGGRQCDGDTSESKECVLTQCPVDGVWSDWGEWSDCPVTCGTGRQIRERKCNNPAPSGGGRQCDGETSENKECVLTQCPVDGVWSDWGEWSDCPVTCGTGQQTRERTCNNPAPSGGGQQCEGDTSENKECVLAQCPVDGVWSDWGEWSDCPVTCGTGRQIRERKCNNPAPSGGGRQCDGDTSESKECVLTQCPVDGVWSDWGEWSDCPVTCGTGRQIRERKCNNPAPSGGGRQCDGLTSENKECVLTQCPVDGVWSDWGEWSDCPVTCGTGQQIRERTCNNPAPSGGGQQCEGDTSENKECVLAQCPVDGVWSDWGEWSDCPVTCGTGRQIRERKCNNPAPSGGGRQCDGDTSESKECVLTQCPVDGVWSDWGEWSDCPVTCGTGRQIRERKCNNPAPSGGGRQCDGLTSENKECVLTQCPVDGVWSDWGEWSDCPVTCGTGQQIRERKCNNPAPSGGGRQCDGDTSENKECVLAQCPVHGVWSDWGKWSDCSVICGTGKQIRERKCNNPAPSGGGRPCDGETSEKKECVLAQCPVDGVWSDWGEWSDCPVTCGTGQQIRERKCNNPAPSGGGRQCGGDTSESKECVLTQCLDRSRMRKTMFEIGTKDFGLKDCEIERIDHTSLVECALRCVHHPRCRSFNFEYKLAVVAPTNHSCGLNSATRRELPEEYVPMPRFQLYCVEPNL